MSIKKAFGPVIWQSDPADTDTLEIRCLAGNVVCAFCVGATCTAVEPSRKIPNMRDTPDWCPYRGQAEADMQEIKDNAA